MEEAGIVRLRGGVSYGMRWRGCATYLVRVYATLECFMYDGPVWRWVGSYSHISLEDAPQV